MIRRFLMAVIDAGAREPARVAAGSAIRITVSFPFRCMAAVARGGHEHVADHEQVDVGVGSMISPRWAVASRPRGRTRSRRRRLRFGRVDLRGRPGRSEFRGLITGHARSLAGPTLA